MRISLAVFVFLFLLVADGVKAQQKSDFVNRISEDSTKVATKKPDYPVKGYIGSFYNISESEFNRGLILRYEELFQGRIPGMNSFSVNGMPGMQHNLFYRGSNLPGGNIDPLILVDNFPVSSGMLFLNPGDIRDISFLSGGIAATIYGSEASWGVLMINTHRNSKKIKLTYTSTIGISVLPEKVENFSAAEIKKLAEPFTVNNQDLARHIGDSDTDWQDAIIRTAAGQNHYLNVSGNTLNVPWQASAGYNSTNGIIETTGSKQLNTSIQLRPEFFQKHLKFNGSLFTHNASSNSDPGNVFKNSVYYNPTVPVYEDNEYGGFFYSKLPDGNVNTIAPVNPVAWLNQREVRNTNDGIIANYSIEYKLHFYPSMKLGILGNFKQSNFNHSVGVDRLAAWANVNGYYKISTSQKTNRQEKLLEPYMIINQYFKKLNTNIYFQTGYRSQRINTDFSEMNHFINDTAKYNTWNKKSIVSYYSLINIEFLHRYQMSFSVLKEIGSQFRNEVQKSLSPGFGLSWNLKKEPFLRNLKFLNDLTAFYSLSRIHTGWIYSRFFQTNAVTDNPFNPSNNLEINGNLKPETVKQIETGIRFQIFDQRISGSFTFYRKIHEDVIIKAPVFSNNSSTYSLVNFPDIESRGIEINLNSMIVKRRKFNVQAGINLSMIKREVTYMPEFIEYLSHGNLSIGVGNYIMILKEGNAPNSFYVYSQMYDASGKPIEGAFTNFSGEAGSVYGNESNRYIFGNADPKLIAAVNLLFNYADFRLGISARMNSGHSVYNEPGTTSYWSGIVFNNYIRNIPKLVENSDFNSSWFNSDFYIEDASFLRFDNVSLSYTFNRFAGINSTLEIEAAVQNAMLFTGYSGIDPETTNGIDYLDYPRPRIYSLSLKFGI